MLGAATEKARLAILKILKNGFTPFLDRIIEVKIGSVWTVKICRSFRSGFNKKVFSFV